MGFAAPVMLAMGVAGAGIQAVGAYEQGQAQSQNAAYQAQVARNNAAIAVQNESWTSAQGAAEEAAQGMKARAVVGGIKARQGANNIAVDTGSAATVRSGATELADLDAMTIRSNTARKAYGYAVEGTSDTAESKLLTAESGQAAEGGDLSALGTFLNGASSVGAKYSAYQSSAPAPGAVGPPLDLLS
jgi:hypothetical protein